jgi:Holliday junction resolvase RusA-like endonuclease
MVKKIILNITPQTWVRVTANDSIFFRIPRDKLRPSGLKRLIRIEKYNDYKVSLRGAANEKHFEIPPQGCGISFFLPCPASWSNKKKKQYHGKLHQQRPDLKNLLQAFEDGLCIEDKYIAHYSNLSKRWVDFPIGWIEVTQSEPSFEFVEMPPLEDKGSL